MTETGLTVSPTLPTKPLEQTILWMIEGIRTPDIVEALAATYPDQNAADLINAAVEHFRTVAAADPVVLRGWALEAYRDLHSKMVRIGDFAGAIRAIEKLEKLARGG